MNKTRLTLFTLAATLGFLANSCGDDDGPKASIVGKWNYDRTITKVENQNPVSQAYAGHEPGCDKDYQEFTATGGYRDVALFQNQNDVCTEFADTGDYAQDDNLLTVQEDGETAKTYTITKLTGSELRYESTAETGGVTITVTQVFKKKS